MSKSKTKSVMSYLQIGYCVWGYNHVNGKDKNTGSITQLCKQVDIVSNMHDTRMGKVCIHCITLIPKRLRLDKDDRKMPKQ